MSRFSRPTMNDVARRAGVGVATVDRVLNGRAPVSSETARRVLEAAEVLGFHAASLMKQRIEDAGVERTLGFLLQRPSQSFYRALAQELTAAARAAVGVRAKPLLVFLDDLTPGSVALALDDLSERVDALAVVAADHPRVSAAVERAEARGVPVLTLLSDLGTPARRAFIGIDHRKAGRSAGWAISRLAERAGKVGIVVGSHRYLGHDLSEISFRSYFRENAPAFQLLEPLASFEDTQFAQEATRDLLLRNAGLVGLYVAGGGIEGVIEALRESGIERRIVVVCNELIAETRAALLDGVVDVVISTPLGELARCAVDAMVGALDGRPPPTGGAVLLPFGLFVAENL